MAKRLDDEEFEAPIERKRRRPHKKPVSDEDEDGGGPSARKTSGNEDGGEDEDSISTGNVLFDIILDFRDDCYFWAKDHFLIAVIIGFISVLLFLVAFGLTIRYIVNYINRPTVETAIAAYDLGAYGEARRYAETVLKFTPPEDMKTKAMLNFIIGASTCTIAEISWTDNRQPFYLAASNYLAEANRLGFPPERRAEGYFLYGKSLYLSGELTQCKEPLKFALEYGASNTKQIFWFLANSYFLDPKPDLIQAIRYIRLFHRDPLVTEDERYEADLLQAMILLQMNEINAAEQAFLRVPLFDRFETMRNFVSGQIDFYKARDLRRQAVDLEQDRRPDSGEPISNLPGPVAPGPVRPEEFSTPFDSLDTEQLLPTSPGLPAETEENKDKNNQENPLDGPILGNPHQPAARPILPRQIKVSDPASGSPWAIVSPVPDDENNDGKHPTLSGTLSRRMGWLAAREEGIIAQNKMENQTNESKMLAPDAVILLPPNMDEEQKKQRPTAAPSPEKLPDGISEQPFLDPRLAKAKQLRNQADEFYEKAILLFRQVQQRDTFVPRWLRTARLLEGICQEEMGRMAEAERVYLDLNESYPSTSEAVVGNFFRAEIERNRGEIETALSVYAKAFDDLRNLPNFSCPWLSKEEMLSRCEEFIRDQLQIKDYKTVLKLLWLLRDIMPGESIARYRSQAYGSWGADIHQQVATTFGEEGETLQKEMYDKYRRAGEAFEELARFRFGETDYSNQLWQAAEYYRLGKDFRRSIPLYQKYLKVNWNDRQPEALYQLGEMYTHLDGIDEAIEYLERALRDQPTHNLVPRIRLALSRAYYEKKEWEKAEKILQSNLVGEYAPTAAIYRDSMYALGKLFYEQGRTDDAMPYLEDAIKIHPNAIQAADAHYCLYQALLKKAEGIESERKNAVLDEVRFQIDHEIRRDWDKALLHAQKAEELLVKRQNAVGLTEAEQLMLRNSIYGAGNLMIKLGRYDQAIPLLQITATRYQGRPESLDALIQLALAYRKSGRDADALPILNHAEVVLNQMIKIGTIPKENRWASQIKLQKNFLLNNEAAAGNRP